MIPVISEGMLALSNFLAMSILAKVSLATALGLAAAWLASGNRAAVRHALLAATFGAILLLPIASGVLPPVQVGVPVGVESRAALPPLVMGGDASPAVATAEAGTRVPPVTALAPELSLSNVLLAAWAIGAVFFLLPVMIGLWQIRSLRRSGLPWRRGQSVVETLALDSGIHRCVEVLLHEALPGPMTCGVVHPVIVLPRDAENWSQEDLNRATIHELEHIRRGDAVTHCLARIVCAAYWFHPLVWIAWRRLVLEAERSCDDAVLGRSEATAYADQLVELAKRLSAPQRSPLLAMANRADLATRVGAVLDARQRRGRAGILALAVACGVAIVLVIAMSPLRLVAAPQAAPVQTVTTPQFDAVSVRPIDRNAEGEKSHEKSGPLRLIAQSQPATVDRTVSAASQPPGATFDVASVRANKSGPQGTNINVRPNGVNLVNVPLRAIIQLAYGIQQPSRLAGVPNWASEERFDITATADAITSRDQLRSMLQALLADRFKLAVHMEKREQPIYALTRARPNDARGPSLRPSTVVCAPPIAGRGDAAVGQGIAAQTTSCGPRPGGPGKMIIVGSPMSQFASVLSIAVGRTVVDQTGLAGNYDIELSYAPEQQRLGPQLADGTAAIPDQNGPSLFTALREQLRLQLKPERENVDVLVVDSVDHPTDN